MSSKNRFETITAEHVMLAVLVGLSLVFLLTPIVQNYPQDARVFPQMMAGAVFVGSALLLVQNYLPAPIYAFVGESMSITSTEDASMEDEDDEATEEQPPRLGEEYGIEVNDTVFMMVTSTLYLAAGWGAGFLFVTLPFVFLYTLWFRIPWYIGLGLGVLATVVIWFFMTFLILPFDQGAIFDFSPFLPFVLEAISIVPEGFAEAVSSLDTRVI